MSLHEIELKTWLRQRIDLSCWNEPQAVTLTFRKIDRQGHLVSRAEAMKGVREFVKRLERKAYGNLVRRKNMHLKNIACYETHFKGGYHCHLAIERPLHWSDHEMRATIAGLWSGNPFVKEILDVRPAYSQGWIDYILKGRSKTDYEFDIDLEHARLA